MNETMTDRNTPRVLLVSGIFYPDVGGPAIHVRRIAEHLAASGWKVTVVAFGEVRDETESCRVVRISRKQPKFISWMRYAAVIVRESFRHDILYAFDLTTAGVPTAVLAKLLRKPFLLRIGGDPIWERVVEQGKRFLPMRAYYEQRLFRHDRPLTYRLICFVVRTADRVVTYSTFLEGIYISYYGVRKERVVIIPNPLPPRQDSEQEKGTFTFIFAGRFVAYKNLERVIRVFGRLHTTHPHVRLVLIGDGPEEKMLKDQAGPLSDAVRILQKIGQEELFKHIKESSVAIAPALTEFNPNFILESLALGKPAIISRDHGLSVQLPDEFQFDPLTDDSLLEVMTRVTDPDEYRAAARVVKELSAASDWHSVIARHEYMLREFTQS